MGRSQLRWFHCQHPNWSKKKLARKLGYSLSWVKKWLNRLAAADRMMKQFYSAGPGHLTATPRADYNAETIITAMVDAFMANGLPEVVTLDRGPRFFGAWTAKNFPSPFMRFLMCLGIRVNVCPPQRPDRNASVERYHLSYDRECLAIHRPDTLPKVIASTTAYQQHYNWQRPNQAISCGNLPPRVAFPDLPKRPGLTTMVDPDGWLNHIRGRLYRRQVKSTCSIQIGRQQYYISRQLRGQSITLRVYAEQKCLVAFQGNKSVKQMPLKGLYNGLMLFEEYPFDVRGDGTK